MPAWASSQHGDWVLRIRLAQREQEETAVHLNSYSRNHIASLSSQSQFTQIWGDVTQTWRWWWTGGPGVLQFMGSQRVGHNWSNWTDTPRATLIAQLLRICLQCRKPRFDSSVRTIHWRKDRLLTPVFLGFLCGSAGKESACNAGDLSSIPRLGRSPGEGKGYLLQYSGLENSMQSVGSQKVENSWATFTFTFHFNIHLLVHTCSAYVSTLCEVGQVP